MEIFTLLIVGLVVGAFARVLLPGRDPGGIVITLLLGIAGSFLAHAVGSRLGWYASGDPAGFLASVAGAFALLLLFRFLFGRRRHE